MSLVQQPQQQQATQSRPVPQSSRKSSNLFKRLMMSSTRQSSRAMSPQLDSSAFSFDSSSSMAVPNTAATSPRQPTRFLRPKRMHCVPSSAHLMEWLQTDCPQDLLPKILAFSGPQLTVRLSQTNKFWHRVVSQEQTWRTLSEELYKVSFVVVILVVFTANTNFSLFFNVS